MTNSSSSLSASSCFSSESLFKEYIPVTLDLSVSTVVLLLVYLQHHCYFPHFFLPKILIYYLHPLSLLEQFQHLIHWIFHQFPYHQDIYLLLLRIRISNSEHCWGWPKDITIWSLSYWSEECQSSYRAPWTWLQVHFGHSRSGASQMIHSNNRLVCHFQKILYRIWNRKQIHKIIWSKFVL